MTEKKKTEIRGLREGLIRKGGLNQQPSTLRPPAPPPGNPPKPAPKKKD